MDRRKIATCQAFTKVNREDKPAPCKLTDAIKTNFNDRVDEIDTLGLQSAPSQNRQPRESQGQGLSSESWLFYINYTTLTN